MEIKRKDMQRSNWLKVTKKHYKYLKEKDYTAGLIEMLEVENDLIVKYPFGYKTIAKKDYKWLEVAYRNYNYFATSMFDENDNLLEIYFDITKKNYFDKDDNPYFDDMFLDIVLDSGGLIYTLDHDELNKALIDKTISEEEYNQAIKDGKLLKDYLENNKEEVMTFFKELYIKMKGM